MPESAVLWRRSTWLDHSSERFADVVVRVLCVATNCRLYHVAFVDDNASVHRWRRHWPQSKPQSPFRDIPSSSARVLFPVVDWTLYEMVIAFAIMIAAILNWRQDGSTLKYISKSQRRSERFIPEAFESWPARLLRNADIPAMVGISFGTWDGIYAGVAPARIPRR